MVSKNLLDRFQIAGIDPTFDRWSAGVEHNPKSTEVMEVLKEVDIAFFGDYFSWKTGGDGDNGESLMYELDLVFDLLDFENKESRGTLS